MADVDVLYEVRFAVEQRRDGYEANGAEREAEECQRYCDAIDQAVRVMNGSKLNAEELERASRGIGPLSSPTLLDQLVAPNRKWVAYGVLMRALREIGRAASGKGPHPMTMLRRLLG